jgi:uncharacterized protein (TIGR03435 family)
MTHRSAIRLVCALVAASLGSASLLATPQQASPRALAFEVVSVEPMDAPQVNGEYTLSQVVAALAGRCQVQPGDRFGASTSLRRLIEFAYGVDQRWDRSRGEDPLLDQWFHVEARGARGSFDVPTADGLSPVQHMLQQMLAERFNVAITFQEETRTAMVLRRASPTRFGPRLQRVIGGCAEGSQAEADARGLARCIWKEQGSKFKVVVNDFEQVAAWISKQGRLDVVNETGLVGAFTFETAFDPYTINPEPPVPPSDTADLDPAVVRMLFGKSHYPYEPSFERAMKNDLDLVIGYEPRPVRVLSIVHVEPLTN